MSDEPRRSVRSTRGQHTKASSSPAPSNPQKATTNSSKPSKKSKKGGKQKKSSATPTEDEGEDDEIRCICGNDDPEDGRVFICCDACSAWQHNICMGEPDNEHETPDHYFCEVCRPEEHRETVQAIASGTKIWEDRNRQYAAWKKMSSQRRKSKGKGGEEARPTWLKAEIFHDDEPAAEVHEPEQKQAEEQEREREGAEDGAQEAGIKRKRDSVKLESDLPQQTSREETAAAPTPSARPDKRRKSSQGGASKAAMDPETAVLPIGELPAARMKIANTFAKIIQDDIAAQVKSGFRIPDGETAKTLGEHHASLIEYAMYQNLGGPTEDRYMPQFRALNANLKKNKVLVERLLDGSLGADELSTMESKDMASEEQQLERKRLKEELDRQAVAVQDEGPMYKQTHKGYERVEDERANISEFTSTAQPIRERTSVAEGAGSPEAAGSPKQQTLSDSKRPSVAQLDRRTSSQQNFDMNNIWQKTAGSAQSPTAASGPGPRPMQLPPRRRSSVQERQQDDGAKEDADVDRLLQDEDDDAYEPQGLYGDDTIAWRGKVVHVGEGEPVVNARFVAGRDLAANTVAWRDFLPEKLTVDGRLAVPKAEEYLCGLQWSQNSDVSVLALSAYDDMDAFNNVFEYFQSRQRYAVVNRDKPTMVRDLYIIPVEKGAGLPEHVGMLEHCSLKTPVEERIMLATFVVARSAAVPQLDGPSASTPNPQASAGSNGQQALPVHMRAGGPGPSGSPLNANNPTFSPNQGQGGAPAAGYGAPHQPGAFPPNPYDQQANAYVPTVVQQPHPNPVVAEVLGPRQWDITAQAILEAQPDIERHRLENLRRVLEEDVGARTNLEALANRLHS